MRNRMPLHLSLITLLMLLCISGFAQQSRLVAGDPSIPTANEVVTPVIIPNAKPASNQRVGALAVAYDLRSDSLALVDLYNATNGSGWLRKTNWLTGRISTWQGITVAGSRVTRVQLNDNTMVGTIPSSIGDLTAMTILQLYNNTLSGGIPASLGNCTALTQLMMQDNPLGGEIPASIGNLVNLTHLYIYRNAVTGTLPSTLSNLTKATIIAFHQNDLTGNLDWIGPQANMTQLWIYSNPRLRATIPSSIGNCTKLTQVYLHGNDLYGTLPASIGNLVNVTQLWLHYNYSLTGPVPSTLSGCIRTQVLSIGDTDLEGPLPSNIGNMTALREIYIENSRISGNLPTDLSRAVNLAIFDMKKINLTAIPAFISGFTKLNKLIINDNKLTALLNLTTHVNKANIIYNVENNQLDFADLEPHFTAPGVHAYADFTYTPQADIGRDTSLSWSPGSSHTLTVSVGGTQNNYQWQKRDGGGNWIDVTGETSNQFIRASAKLSDAGDYRLKITNTKIPALTLYTKVFSINVGCFTSLQEQYDVLMDLYATLNGSAWTNNTGWSNANPDVVQSVVGWYGIQTDAQGFVTNLSLPGNNLSGALTQDIGKLCKLRVLDLSSNHLTGSLPASWGSLVDLYYLHLGGNQLSGAIPPEIGAMPSLRQLFLHANALTGEIPASVWNMTTLTELTLDSNQISGTLPAALGNLVNLENLGLANNRISGGIPASVGLLTKLRRLDISANQLTTALPPEIGGLSALIQLHLGGNQIVGSIPQEIGNLSALRFLYLHANQISGNIPSTIGNLGSLVELQLHSNNLEGAIPNTITNLGNVEIISLESNDLTGELPSSIGNMTKLRLLNIGSNQLTGSLPPGIGQLSALSYLHLGGNRLSGSLPTEFGNLSSLQTLYLHSNQFTGPIPASFGQLSNLVEVLLHANQFSGNLPVEIGNLSSLRSVSFDSNQISGSLPESMGNMTALERFSINNNRLTGALPSTLGNLTALQFLDVNANNLSGGVPESLTTLPVLRELNVNNNAFTAFPDFTTSPNKAALTIRLYANQISFADLEPNFTAPGVHPFLQFLYINQNAISDLTSVVLSISNELTIPARPKGLHSTVVWEKQQPDGTWLDVTAFNQDPSGQTFFLSNGYGERGRKFRWRMTNAMATGFSIVSEAITVEANPDVIIVQWRELSGVQDTNGQLARTSQTAGWDAGANSANVLHANQDGWIQFSARQINNRYSIGFAINDYAFTPWNIVHNFFIQDGSLYLSEYNATTEYGAIEENDILKIERSGNTVRYYRNNEVIRTVETNPLMDLKVKASLYNGPTPEIFTSIPSEIWLTPVVNGTNFTNHGGSIDAVASDGVSPYSWTWSSGESTQSISGKSNGDYTVTVSDASGKATVRSYGMGYVTYWTDLTDVSDNGGALTRTSAGPGWGAGANSENVLPSGTDGWIEFIVGNTHSVYAIGLSANAHQFTPWNGLYTYYTDAEGQLYAQDNAVNTLLGSVQKGDALKIERRGNQIFFYRNGVVLRTSTSDPVYDLKVNVAIYQGSAPKVVSSFVAPLLADAVISPVITNVGGGITINLSNAVEPVSYQWSSGETTASISGKPVGNYAVTITDAAGRSLSANYSVGYETQWKELINVTELNGALTKATTSNDWDAGANSSNVLPGNENGWIEFAAVKSEASYAVGFSINDHIMSVWHTLYAFHVQSDGTLYIRDQAASYLVGAVQKHDVFRIAREGNQVIFYRNGDPIRMSAADPSLELKTKATVARGTSPAVIASNDKRIWLSGVISPIQSGASTGSVTVTATQGQSPYSYQWSSGEVGAAISNKSIGEYTLTVTDQGGRSATRAYAVGYATPWTEVTGVVESNGELRKITADGWNAGAISGTVLEGGQDGWFQFIVENSLNQYAIGLKTVTAAAGQSARVGAAATAAPDFSPWSVYGFYVSVDGYVYAYNIGQTVAVRSKQAGDVYKVVRTGSAIQYYRNGTVIGSVTVDAAANFAIQNSVYTGVSPMVVSSLASESLVAAEWMDRIAVTEANGTLTKNVVNPGWNAGANSSNLLLAETDGSLEFVIADNTSHFAIGFTTNTPAYHQGGINYGVLIEPSKPIAIVERNAGTPTTFAWAVGDKIRVTREGNVVTYWKNDEEMGTVDVDAATELRVKSVIQTGTSPAVMVSFDVRLSITASITPVKGSGTSGGVALFPYTGASPYTYLWQGGGETTASITNKTLGAYSVTVTDQRGRTADMVYSLGYRMHWTSLKNVNNNNGLLSRTTTDLWGSGAESFNVIPANEDGWIEFVISNAASQYVIGFSGETANVTTGSVLHGIHIEPAMKIAAWENGAKGTDLTSWQIGDAIRIARIGGFVRYYRNGMEIGSAPTNAALPLITKVVMNYGATSLVVASSDAPLIILAAITPVKSYGLAGAMTVSPLSGSAPYSYTWSSGETTQSVTNKALGAYTVTVRDGDGRTVTRPVDLGYQIYWTDLNDVTNDNNARLTKTSQDGLYGGANSVNRLKANEDGWFEYIIESNANLFSVGLATPSNIFNPAAIDYSFNVKAGDLSTSENDWTGASAGAWSVGDVLKIVRTGSEIIYYRNGDLVKSVSTDASKELLVKVVIQKGSTGLMQLSRPVNDFSSTPIDPETYAYKIPAAVKITRDGRIPQVTKEQSFLLSSINQGDAKQVFPGCIAGKYTVGFQLNYDLGDHNTSENWESLVQITLLHDENVLATMPLKLDMASQTFISTAFYDELITCDGKHYFHIDFKTPTGNVPEGNIDLKVLLFEKNEAIFMPSFGMQVFCQTELPNHKVSLNWTHSLKSVTEYDVEWVFIDAYQPFSGSAQDAFTLREPARITTSERSYTHQVYYPNGKVYYRVRAVGINPEHPGHRITGIWNYFNCLNNTVTNHQPEMTWQEKTIFAEEGEYKKVITYYDGTLRERQAQVNLSTEEVTMVDEKLYDFEGRASVAVLPGLSPDNTLTYKPGFNQFQSIDNTVRDLSTGNHRKINYDNRNLENSILKNTSGTSQYYSANNTTNSVHRDYIPDGEGYVYSQTEFLNDATGRPVAQSGVGKTFRVDGIHTARNAYGQAAPEELVRLFGSNVGVAAHYKKELGVDANGQVSIIYKDQEGRTIATALAGTSPNNVEALDSYNALPTDDLVINLSSKNKKQNGISQLSHKILNAAPATEITFTYDLKALASVIDELGCQICSFDLRISLTDPDGKMIDLSTVTGSDPQNQTTDYVKSNINATCTAATDFNVTFSRVLNQIGDYTVTKTLVPHELTFEQMGTLVKTMESVQEKVALINNGYPDDPDYCKICYDPENMDCPEVEQIINESIDEIAEQDCENILRQIEQHFQDKYDEEYRAAHDGESSDEIYVVPQADLESHELWCKYQLCSTNRASDVFEKQIVRASDWDDAIARQVTDLINLDPFFNDPALSGAGAKNDMVGALSNISLGIFKGREYKGSLAAVTNPDDLNFYIDKDGNYNVNGYHILYMDLMEKRRNNRISEQDYLDQLSLQRWAMYRGFYTEAKRQIKLNLEDFKKCPATIEDLKATDELPDSEEEIDDWANENDMSYEITPEDVETVMYRLKTQCHEMTLSPAHEEEIAAHFKAYLESNARENFFKLIFTEDLEDDEHLEAIQQILNNYSCSLTTIANANPLTCKEETVIIRNDGSAPPVETTAEQGLAIAEHQPDAEEAATTESNEAVSEEAPFTAPFGPQGEQVSQINRASLRAGGGIVALAMTDTEKRNQFNALVDLYNALRQDGPWVFANGWSAAVYDNPVPIVNWTGVTVDAEGWVTQLSFSSSNNMVGQLPASIVALKKLSYFNLPGDQYTPNVNRNVISGAIPTTINSLTELTSLNLSGNQLVAPMPDISALTKLHTLYLNGNYTLQSTLPDVSTLKALRTLNLSGCRLVIDNSKIETLIDLQYLDLSSNPISKLPVNFPDLVNLVNLRMSGCGLTELPPTMGKNWTALTSLTISSNNLLKQLNNYFRGNLGGNDNGMNNLTTLDLTHNGLTSLPANFGKNLSSLVALSIYNNQLKALSDYFNGLADGMKSLETLYVSYRTSNITWYNNTLESLPANFGVNWSSLKTLHMESNDFEDYELPGTFNGNEGSMKNLVTLYFAYNVLHTLPANFGQNWTSLKTLYLDSNRLYGLPDTFRGAYGSDQGMTNLEFLQLTNNLIPTLPDHFGLNMVSLKTLYLDQNKLTQLPDYFRGSNSSGNAMNNLEFLSITFNPELEALPEHFGENMPKLVQLNLFSNGLKSLSGYFQGITFDRQGMFALKYLYLYDNKLPGLPSNFGEKWSSLIQLRLEKNYLTSLSDYFCGVTPAVHGMDKLQILYLGQDYLYNENRKSNLLVTLPANFGHNWSSLLQLYIPSNSLRSLPDFFRGISPSGDGINGMSGLICLYLLNYDLESLPGSFGEKWTSLGTLMLYNNKLQELPDYFRGANEIGNGMNNLVTLYLGYQFSSYYLYYSTSSEQYTIYGSVTDFKANLIHTLPQHFGQNWTRIQELHMEGNKIKTLPDYFRGTTAAGPGMTAIRNLYLNNNELTALPEHFGEGLVTLDLLSLYANQLTQLPDYFRGRNSTGDGMNNLTRLYLGNKYKTLAYGSNRIAALPEHFGESWTKMDELHMEGNQLTSLTPYFNGDATGMPKLKKLFMQENLINGLPGNFADNWSTMEFLMAYGNQLTAFDGTGTHMPNVLFVDISENRLPSFPSSLWSFPKMQYLNVAGNEMRGAIDPNIPITVTTFSCSNNFLTFFDFIHVAENFKGKYYYGVTAYPQKPVDQARIIQGSPQVAFTLTTSIDKDLQAAFGTNFKNCTYQWFKINAAGQTTQLNTNSETGHTVTYTPTSDDEGAQFYYTIKNPTTAAQLPFAVRVNLSSLTLKSFYQTLSLSEPETFTFCSEYDEENETIKLYRFDVDWQVEIQKCIDNLHAEQAVLKEISIEKLVEEEVSTFYNVFSTNCLAGVNEKFKYAYQNKEYHYTLYYYDQAGNLVQTVPPEGVEPLSGVVLENAMDGNMVDPQHRLVTRYKFNSLNQLEWQQSPDAGTSRFWYNKKGQLKLSQNAQQTEDHNYSYTKYDEQGRLVEVGAMNTNETPSNLLEHIEEMNFPDESVFTLSDITRTHYDFGKRGFKIIDQQNLRSRVAFVEVIEKDATDTIATHYTYDIHGNVKSLVQQIPGLGFKRMDYVYNLISSKVNCVMYQYDNPDEFIHRYSYDADSRIREVYTSADGFIWDNDASYAYYHHGSLARTELGEYRVQGLDYYYTLQGWIKGVNGVIDPGADGGVGSLVPKDEMSFNVGYYQNDFVGIGLGTVSNFYQQPMQRYTEMMGNTGLFNGNISWMSTDLKKIGQIKHSRNKGTQAMVYRYDQLNRLSKSRSLTEFDPVTGFASRTDDPAAYDGDYSYDANGNLLTLQRRNVTGGILNDFKYEYYEGTNKLRQLVPVLRDTVYDGGAVTSNQKVYRNITIQGTSFVPSGKDVTIKAIDNIHVDPEFDVEDNASFHAYVLSDEEGMYLYDAIGNLTWDQEEGVKISWTPNDKVRTVVKGDTTTVSFRYDVSGNRVEKKVHHKDKISTTYYLRDAVGNVMATYKNTTVVEHFIIGSGRLGLCQPGRKIGHRTLGAKHFETSNHLGNVLAVIADNIYMSADSTWTKVVSTNDYYPFGLNMEGRNFSDTTYRYGFNGKEKDDKGEFGNTHYDYGLRIYNPVIARFISVDPLTGDYPWYTPYQFAGNDVIRNIDLDGGEPKPATTGNEVEGQSTTTSETRLQGKSDMPYTLTETWFYHEGGVDGSEAGWMTAEDYYEDILKPIAKADNAGDFSPKFDFAFSRKELGDTYIDMINSVAAYVKANPTYDHWTKWIPIWGSGVQAGMDFSVGKYGWGTFNAALCVSDVFLVKSICQAPLKAMLTRGTGGLKSYFGVGLSHEYGNSVARWRRLGLDVSGYKHHWLISQELMKAYPALKPFGNQTWNLTRFGSQSSHMRWGHFTAYPSLNLEKIPGAQLFYPFSSTPNWLKLGVVPSFGGRALEYGNRE